MSLRIKKGDLVIVRTGSKDIKGQQGRVISVLDGGDRVIVEGLNKVKRHLKPAPRREGGIFEKEMPIQASRVALIDPTTGKATRFKTVEKDGKKIRVAVKSGAEFTQTEG
jgi:large subunit ribosomal protein L24